MDRTPGRSAALATLRERWGTAAPRPATEVFGALAAAPVPASGSPLPAPGQALPILRPPLPAIVALPGLAGGVDPALTRPRPAVPDAAGRIISTGFAELDALLGLGGLPRPGSVALAGAGSAGTTTLALRAVASAQAAGALAAWVDGSRSLDPVEAVARGVHLEWLAVLVPGDPAEGLEMAGMLLQSRAVDILVLDPGDGRAPAGGGARSRSSGATLARPSSPADRLDRLLALARRVGALLVVLEPAELPAGLHGVLDGAGLRLELRRRGWIRLGREVVGQRTEVRVARDHHGLPDRLTELRILYAEGGARDRCLRRPELLQEASTDAPAPPCLAAPPPPSRARARPGSPGRGADRPRRAAVG